MRELGKGLQKRIQGRIPRSEGSSFRGALIVAKGVNPGGGRDVRKVIPYKEGGTTRCVRKSGFG